MILVSVLLSQNDYSGILQCQLEIIILYKEAQFIFQIFFSPFWDLLILPP